MSNHVGARAPRPHLGWHSRGYVPHFDGGAVVQTVTFHLADSLPRQFYEKASDPALNDRKRYFQIEKIIDDGRGGCLLREASNAEIVRAVLHNADGEQYRLLAWVVMPNHVHVVVEQISGHRLPDVVQSWKSVSAHAINKRRGARGPIWAPDYFDRYVRDADHYRNAVHYIESNPVKARLVAKASDWPFSSASVERHDAGEGARPETVP